MLTKRKLKAQVKMLEQVNSKLIEILVLSVKENEKLEEVVKELKGGEYISEDNWCEDCGSWH